MGHTKVWHHTVSWTITFFFRLLHETPMKNRAKSAESKGKKVTDKKRVFSVVGKEDKKKPLSDDALTKQLAKLGYPIARRTVAKYREQLGLPIARLRKD